MGRRHQRGGPSGEQVASCEGCRCGRSGYSATSFRSRTELATTSQILPRYRLNVTNIPTSPKHCQYITNTLSTSRQYVTITNINNTLLDNQNYTNTLPKYHQDIARISSEQNVNITNTSPMLYQNIAKASPTHYQHAARISPDHHLHIPNISPVHHQHIATTSLSSHERITTALPKQHQHIDTTLTQTHQNSFRSSSTHNEHFTSTSLRCR